MIKYIQVVGTCTSKSEKEPNTSGGSSRCYASMPPPPVASFRTAERRITRKSNPHKAPISWLIIQICGMWMECAMGFCWSCWLFWCMQIMAYYSFSIVLKYCFGIVLKCFASFWTNIFLCFLASKIEANTVAIKKNKTVLASSKSFKL